jgi:hypothetical protein
VMLDESGKIPVTYINLISRAKRPVSSNTPKDTRRNARDRACRAQIPLIGEWRQQVEACYTAFTFCRSLGPCRVRKLQSLPKKVLRLLRLPAPAQSLST